MPSGHLDFPRKRKPALHVQRADLAGIDSVLPVSAYIPGCPASPNAIIDGVVKLLSSLEAKEEVAAVKPEIAGELGPET